jgi:hypothetical protein
MGLVLGKKMATALVVLLLIVAAFVFLAFGTKFGSDPSTKTLSQLRLVEKLHFKRVQAMDLFDPKRSEAVEQWTRVMDEIKKRETAAEIATLSAIANVSAKIKSTVDMFRSGIAPEKLRRGANKNELQYYIGYIVAISRCMAETDGVSPDGVILASAQIEASRLLGMSAGNDGDYAEGIEILPAILTSNGAREGQHDGEIDGHYVVNPRNPHPYFGKLRSRFDVKLRKR